MGNTSSDNYQRRNCNVAIYCRLSNDDGEKKESNSIANQKSMLMEHISKMGWKLYNIYIDDGFTGTNFNRPGFKKLIEDIEDKKIDIVLTKDMSRLGRDYIQVGYYIERYFPEKGVGYIALNDNIDTHRNIDGDDITPFKAIINDMYSKDISKKIRSVFNIKRREGKFIGAFAPYGYKKDLDDKDRLIIDEEVAPVVKRIFDMYLSGQGFTSIAKKLNNDGISPPAINKSKRLENYRHGRIKTPKWCHSGVKHILTNPTYTGDLAQGKSKKINYKSSKIKRLNQEEWIIARGVHEPIISKENFQLVQGLMNQEKKKYGGAKRSIKLFSGFLFCGECGQYMTYYKMPKGYYFLICSTYKRYGKEECTRHSILEEELKGIILDDIKDIFKRNLNKSCLRDKCKKALDLKRKESKGNDYELIMIKKRIEELKNPLKSLYEDKVKGVINNSQFQQLYDDFNKEKESLLKRKKGLELEEKNKKNITMDERVDNLIDSLFNLNNLNRLILTELINKVEVFEDGRVKIHYKFKVKHS